MLGYTDEAPPRHQELQQLYGFLYPPSPSSQQRSTGETTIIIYRRCININNDR